MMENERIMWREEFSIGNIDIDEVHKKLIDIYNELVDYNGSQENLEDFALILTKMTEYSLIHFNKEEEYMKKLSYPDLMTHKNYHKVYIYKVSMFNIDFKGVEHPEIKEVILFLKKWWVNHILNIDKKYEDYKKEINADVKY